MTIWVCDEKQMFFKGQVEREGEETLNSFSDINRKCRQIIKSIFVAFENFLLIRDVFCDKRRDSHYVFLEVNNNSASEFLQTDLKRYR